MRSIVATAVFLLPALGLAQPLPQPKLAGPGGSCPHGYSSSGSFCVPREHYVGDGGIIYQHACKLGFEGIVSKRLGSPYRSGRSKHWIKIKNPDAPAVKREAEEEWRSVRRR